MSHTDFMEKYVLPFVYAIIFILLFSGLIGCSSTSSSSRAPEQELIVDAKVQPMGRNEVIDAVRQCESSGLRAIPLYAKRKINGYTVETVVEVTCGPKYLY
jgi:hypothetical protein